MVQISRTNVFKTAVFLLSHLASSGSHEVLDNISALYLTVIPRTRVGYELLDSGRGAAIISSYPTNVSRIYQTPDFVYVEVLNVNQCNIATVYYY